MVSITSPSCCGGQNGICQLKKGTNVTILLTYTTKKEFASMKHGLCATLSIMGATECMSMPNLESDFCKFTTCPIPGNIENTAKLVFPVPTGYPDVR